MLSKLTNINKMDLATFKNKLEGIWNDIPPDVVRATCAGFPRRLKAVVKENGERFENR